MAYIIEPHVKRMQAALEANNHKVHWSKCSLHGLNLNLEKKMPKLLDAICKNDFKGIVKHATDISNYGMMLAENAQEHLNNRAKR